MHIQVVKSIYRKISLHVAIMQNHCLYTLHTCIYIPQYRRAMGLVSLQSINLCSSSTSVLLPLPPQSLLFNPQQGLFLHQPSSALALTPTFTDLGMMVTCLVAQFRCNYRNSHIFSVCLNPSSPPIFRLAFIKSIHTLLKQVCCVD